MPNSHVILLAIKGLARRFAAARRGSAAVEFAMSGLALFAFLMVIINLGDLGLTVGALQHGLQGAARQAAVTAAANLSGNGAVATCPVASDVRGYFNAFTSPALRAATGSTTDGSPQLSSANGNLTGSTSPWTSGTTPAGTFIKLTASYKWTPIGFASLGPGVTLSLTTMAFVMGTSSGTPTCP
jgi:Flp pilus assembly protein TadG